MFQVAVDVADAKLARVEQIKHFSVLGEEWAPGRDELTLTLKLKRKPIAAKIARGDRVYVRLSVVSPGWRR